jgi:hypothetical protein
MSDEMICIAHLVSRGEALVVTSMLDNYGFITHISGGYHASVEMNSVALGGFRITVPVSQYRQASGILGETFANTEPYFSSSLQTAVIRLLLTWWGLMAAALTIQIPATQVFPIYSYLFIPVTTLGIPVNPQGKGDYFLSDEDNTLD